MNFMPDKTVIGLLLLSLLLAGRVIAAEAPSSECPQPRFTDKAPPDYLARTNPLANDAEVLAAGEALYNGKANALPCAICHGVNGDGKGKLAGQYDPRPRNFTCKDTVNGIPDGQLFWIIRYGSPGTAMPASRKLTDQQIWQLVTHLRKLAQQ